MRSRIITTLILTFSILFSSCETDPAPISVLEQDYQLVPCSDCPTLTDFKDTLEFATALRKFIATKADNGNLRNQRCDTFYKLPPSHFSVKEYLKLFEEDLCSSTCGLSSALMVKILNENGIDAYTYNFGFTSSRWNHVVVLMKQGNDLLIYDPFFNYELLDTSGRNLDLMSLIDMIKSQEIQVRFTQDTVIGESLLVPLASKETEHLLRDSSCMSFISNWETVRDSVYKVRFLKCYSCALNRPCFSWIQEFEKELQKRTDHNSIIEAFSLKINELGGSSDRHEIESSIMRKINMHN